MPKRNRIKIGVFVLFPAFIITALVYYNIVTIRHGEIDYSLIEDGKSPLYAKEYATYLDGGAIWYVGNRYSIFKIYRPWKENGVWGYLVGPQIRYAFFVIGGKNRESLHFIADPNENP